MASKNVNLNKKPNLEKKASASITLKGFMETEFDKMIMYADWQRGETLKKLISEYTK